LQPLGLDSGVDEVMNDRRREVLKAGGEEVMARCKILEILLHFLGICENQLPEVLSREIWIHDTNESCPLWTQEMKKWTL
jgi:hypothetical protein